jgi:hypothetical protein
VLIPEGMGELICAVRTLNLLSFSHFHHHNKQTFKLERTGEQSEHLPAYEPQRD